MARVSTCQFALPAALRPLRAPLAVESYPGIDALWGRATQRRGDAVYGVEALVVHCAARSDTDRALALMAAGRASWHWIIPAPHEEQHGRFLWAVAPEGRAARHLPPRLSHPAIAGGRPRLNLATLAVLLAADPGTPGAAPSDWQVDALAGLVRHLWARYPALGLVMCRSVLDPACDSRLDWEALRARTTLAPTGDLPESVAHATPLSLLDRPEPPEPALRGG